VSANPYEPPLAPVFEEADGSQMVFDISQKSPVEWFIVLNGVVGLTFIGTGGAMALVAPVVFIARGAVSPTLIATWLLGFAVIALGTFQFKRNLAAISFTGATVVALFATAAINMILSEIGGAPWPVRSLSVGKQLICLAMVSAMIWAMVYVPAWLAVRAWIWQLNGIDLAALDKIKYRRVGDDL
jgi:hypothetical protein